MHVSTPYGLVLDDITDLANELVLAYCFRHKFDIKGLPILLPIYRLAREWQRQERYLSRFDPSYRFASSLLWWFIRPWAQLQLLERLLEGGDDGIIKAATDADAVAALEHYETLTLHESDPWPLGLVRAKHKGRLFQTLNLETRPLEKVLSAKDVIGKPMGACPTTGDRPLGGLHILEGIAHHVQDIKLHLTTGMFDTPGTFPYLTLWTETIQKYGLTIKSQDEFNSVNSSFLALCDPALFVPIGPVYGRLRRPKIP